jgi:hypothetical protein
MCVTDIKKTKGQSECAASNVEPRYITALLSLHKILSKSHFNWTIGGELGEALRMVDVKSDCIEILTSKKGVTQIFLAFKGRSTKGVYFQIQRVGRNATVNQKNYPVYLRSFYFEFTLNDVKVKVYGDLQFRINNENWGDKLEFTPEHIYLVGMKTAVVPLQVKYELYQKLGWKDRAEMIQRVLSRHSSTPR